MIKFENKRTEFYENENIVCVVNIGHVNFRSISILS